MDPPADAQQCKAAEMIKFLLAVCRSGYDRTVPIHDEQVLRHAFEEARNIANRSGTPLQAGLRKFRKARNELCMCTPFVLACNYALDKLSEVEVAGFPPFEPEKQIVFVRNDEQNHQRESQVKPDIVVLQRNFLERLSANPSNASIAGYSDFSTSKSDLKLSWGDVRLTVKATKFGSLPKRKEWLATFGKDFGSLEESPPHPSLVHNFQPAFTPEELPASLGGSLSLNISTGGNRRSERPAGKESRATVVDVPMSTGTKRKLASVLGDGDGRGLAIKRSNGDGREASSAQNREDNVMGVAESSIALTVSQKSPANIQNGISAVERPSCSFQVTHSINFVLLGSTMYITWSDRQNVIRTGGFDIDDSLPHFLLVLLILQRFDPARWGFFTEFPDSSFQPIRNIHQTHILRITSTDNLVTIIPDHDPVYGGINLAGRSTSVAGARKDGDQHQGLTSSGCIRNANDLVIKFFWSEETWVGEVTSNKAEGIKNTNGLVKGPIPTILGDMHSTSLIRRFLGLDTSGARLLQAIVIRHPDIKYLDKKYMQNTFSDCFFCHWRPQGRHFKHGCTGTGNLVYDQVTKRGVLNDLNLAPDGGFHRKPGTKENLNTGTIPFSALDLIDTKASKGLVPRQYRHDAESFAWCLVYICACQGKDNEGRISTIKSHPLSLWFTNAYRSSRSKASLISTKFLNDPPLHKKAAPLAVALQNYWVGRYLNKSTTICPASLEHQTGESHMQPSDLESLKRVLEIHESVIHTLPEPQAKLIRDNAATIRSLCSLE